MKRVLLIVVLIMVSLIFVSFVYDEECVEKTVTILDEKTREPLCGVYVNGDYTDFDGKVTIKENYLDVYFISYETITCDVVDTLYLVQE